MANSFGKERNETTRGLSIARPNKTDGRKEAQFDILSFAKCRMSNDSVADLYDDDEEERKEIIK